MTCVVPAAAQVMVMQTVPFESRLCRASCNRPQRGRTAKPRVAKRTLGDEPTEHQPQRGCTGAAVLCNPVGVDKYLSIINPGCAARPWALLFDLFEVMFHYAISG